MPIWTKYFIVIVYFALFEANSHSFCSYINASGNTTHQRAYHHLSKEISSCNLPRVLVDKDIIIPKGSCSSFEVLRCYCLTSNHCISAPCSAEPQLFVGKCLYGCFKTEHTREYHYVNLSSIGICSTVNRKGILCGECQKDYGVPVYSFNLKCVHCGNESLWTTIPRYILVAYGPLTVFLAVIVVFTVSVNSAPLRGWILVCQILTGNSVMYIVTMDNEFIIDSHLSPFVHIFGSVYGVWNLDFFRSVYKPFCLHPSLTTLQVMSLDYIIAVYPLVLIVVMYAMVELYSRNCRPMVLLGRLLHHCCVRFRHQLDIRTSLVDAFGTFFSLSFVRFLSTTANLLTSTAVWNNRSNISSWHVFFDGTKQPFRGNHIPYAVIATLVTLLCTILPLFLMLIHSFPRGQRILNILPGSVQRAMYPFVDNILACYKDGTNGTRNCRYFAVVYYFALIGSLTSLSFAKNPLTLGWNSYVCILAGMLVAVIQPYKSKVYNTVDIVLLLSVGLCFTAGTSYFITFVEAPFEKPQVFAMIIIPVLAPMLYFFVYIGLKCFFKGRSLFNRCFSTPHEMTVVAHQQPLLFNLQLD